MKKSLFILAISLLSSLSLSAKTDKDEWIPVASWPFVYQEFQNATIRTKDGKIVRGMADIHVGMHYLWYENSKKKKMAAAEGTIAKVTFSNGDIYMPVEKKLCKVIVEDTIRGQVCRVYRSDEVDKDRFNELARINNMGMQTMDIAGLNDTFTQVAEHEGSNILEQNPLPMNTVFYMLYNGETFLVTESNILKRLDKSERAAYRAFTRKAEIIYGNEKSVLSIWSAFMNRE